MHADVTPPGRTVHTTVNGGPVEVDVEDRTTVAELLRDHLGLTGTKVSCESHVCGVCTVLLDGRAVSACCTLVHEVDGREVRTIEGLAGEGGLHPVQEAFVRHAAFQCGFCTPGMIMAAVALLEEHGDPGADEIRSALAGNVCRCTGYASIVAAVRAAGSSGTGSPDQP